MKICLRTYENASSVYLEVEDNGIGIEATGIHQVFDPFYTTKEPDKGTGLGLSISYGLIKRMQGTLDVESRYGHGTLMRAIFPRQPRNEEAVTDTECPEKRSVVPPVSLLKNLSIPTYDKTGMEL